MLSPSRVFLDSLCFFRVNFFLRVCVGLFPFVFFWKISLCSPVDYFSLRILLAETKFMFEFFFPFAVVSFLSFGLYLKGVVRVFFPLDLKGFLRFVFKKLSPGLVVSPTSPTRLVLFFVLVVYWVRP